MEAAIPRVPPPRWLGLPPRGRSGAVSVRPHQSLWWHWVTACDQHQQLPGGDGSAGTGCTGHTGAGTTYERLWAGAVARGTRERLSRDGGGSVQARWWCQGCGPQALLLHWAPRGLEAPAAEAASLGSEPRRAGPGLQRPDGWRAVKMRRNPWHVPVTVPSPPGRGGHAVLGCQGTRGRAGAPALLLPMARAEVIAGSVRPGAGFFRSRVPAQRAR